LFARPKKNQEHVSLDKRKDVDAWVQRHFRRFRLDGPKKVLPKWVFDSLVKLYGNLVQQGAILNLEAELDTRIREFIEDVVRVGMKNHKFTSRYNADDRKLVLVADCAEGKARALHDDFRGLEDTLRLHGFYGIFSKHTAPKDGKMYFILDLTQLDVDVRSVAVWLLLNDYRKSPILWNGDVWVPEEVPDNADAAVEHLL
jgi:hypothetical protein